MRTVIEQLLSMFCMLKKKVYLADVSKHKPNREKKSLLMILNGQGWYYLEVIKLSTLLRKGE